MGTDDFFDQFPFQRIGDAAIMPSADAGSTNRTTASAAAVVGVESAPAAAAAADCAKPQPAMLKQETPESCVADPLAGAAAAGAAAAGVVSGVKAEPSDCKADTKVEAESVEAESVEAESVASPGKQPSKQREGPAWSDWNELRCLLVFAAYALMMCISFVSTLHGEGLVQMAEANRRLGIRLDHRVDALKEEMVMQDMHMASTDTAIVRRQRDLETTVTVLQQQYGELQAKLGSPAQLALILAAQLAPKTNDSVCAQKSPASADAVLLVPVTIMPSDKTTDVNQRYPDYRKECVNLERSSYGGRAKFVLVAGERLFVDEWITSCNGIYRTLMHLDRNLVTYRAGPEEDWTPHLWANSDDRRQHAIWALNFDGRRRPPSIEIRDVGFQLDPMSTYAKYEVGREPNSCAIHICQSSKIVGRSPICTRYLARDLGLAYDPPCVAAYRAASSQDIERNCGAIRLSSSGQLAATARP
jgi:hypothetical protein